MPRPVMTSPHRKIRTVGVVAWAERVSSEAPIGEARSAWPKVVQRFWCRSLGILQLRRRHVRGEQSKYGAGNLLRIDAGVAMHAVVDPIQECAAALGGSMSAGVPAVVVKTAKQGRQLCSDIHRFVSRQTV